MLAETDRKFAVDGESTLNELVCDAERIWATAIESWFGATSGYCMTSATINR